MDFNDSQFQADYVNANFDEDNVFDAFFQTISENVSYFVKQTKQDVTNYFSHFPTACHSMLRESLADSFLEYNYLNKSYKIKNKSTKQSILSDIYDLFQLLTATNEQLTTYDMTLLFNKIIRRKGINPDLITAITDAINKAQAPLLVEISDLKSKVVNQNLLITKLTNEIDKIGKSSCSKSSFSFTAPNIQQSPQPQLMSNLFKQNAQTNGTISGTNLTGDQANLNNNNNNNNNNNKTPRTQSTSAPNQNRIHSYNSFDPHSKSAVIDLTNNNDGFTLVGKTQKQNNNNNNRNNNNRNNNRNNNINNNKNNNNNVNKNKTNFIDTLGTGSFTSLGTISKQFYIYLGRISTGTTIKQVSAFLSNTFPLIKFNNIKELNSHAIDRSFNSFTFSVDFLDKDIINNKTLWPRNCVVNKHKLPYAEWQAIAKRIEEKKNQSSSSTASKTASTTASTTAASVNLNNNNNNNNSTSTTATNNTMEEI